jgi:biopolymer transport protein ExbD
MRFARSRSQDRGRPLINMTSMIDATFLLLSFFLVTTAMQRMEGKLTGALDTTAAGKGDLQAVVVEVDGAPGAVQFRVAGRTLADAAALRELLQPLPKEPGVAVRVRNGPSVADAAAVLQLVRDAGFERVSYAAAP